MYVLSLSYPMHVVWSTTLKPFAATALKDRGTCVQVLFHHVHASNYACMFCMEAEFNRMITGRPVD